MPSVRHLVTHSQEELAGWLSRAGIYALPARYEPSGLAALDAAAAGCALVLGDIDSFREYWDGAAVFVPPNEPDAIGRTLRHLIQDEPLRLCLAQQARQRARQFRPQRMAMEYIGAYHHLLHEAGQNVPVQQPALVTLDVHMSFSDGV